MPKPETRDSKPEAPRALVPHSALPTPHSIVPKLLAWFAANARDLPWRCTCDPYAIWVSEIMLQQTQVKTVIPYWERWLRELPNIEALAKATPEKIHKLWEGLGYYTRVRNMQKAAQQIVRIEKQKAESRKQKGEAGQHPTSNIERRTSKESSRAAHVVTNQFPTEFDAILALPGIGRYTAGAIASIAFNQPAPILDGNVIRVLTRLHGIGEDPQERQTNVRLWQLAGELVRAASETGHATRNTQQGIKSKITIKIKNPETPGPCSALNQSLMELGALICTPRTPNCSACPVAKHCVALRENRVDELPRPKQRAAVTARQFVVFVVKRSGKFLVQQRGDNVVNAQLWEFPNVEVGARLSPAAARPANQDATEFQNALANEALRLGQPRSGKGTAAKSLVVSTKPFCVVKHSITRYRMTAEAYRVSLGVARLKLPGVWRTLAQLRKLPFTSAHRRIATQLGLP